MPFPAPPAPRIAYDIDGTSVFLKTSKGAAQPSTLLECAPLAVQALNTTNPGGMTIDNTQWTGPDSSTYTSAYLLFLFPVNIDLAGIFWVGPRGGIYSPYTDYLSLETSRDTTNGDDGTWLVADTVQVGVPDATPVFSSGTCVNSVTGVVTTDGVLPVSPFYRNDQSVTPLQGINRLAGPNYAGIKALRLKVTPGLIGNSYTQPVSGNYVVHLYGLPSYNAAVNRVAPWESALDIPLAQDSMSWGDVAPGSTQDRTLRLKNMSPAQSANNILVYAEDEYNYPTSMASQILLSLDGISWSTSVTLTAISSMSISPLIRVRRTTPVNSPLSTWSPRLRFDVGSWT